MPDPRIFIFLLAATTLEASGDAIIRLGLERNSLARAGLFAGGGCLLFGYGLLLNLAPLEFRKVVGIYIATLFIVWQVVNYVTFRTLPGAPVLVGGSLIVLGGLIVSFWKSGVSKGI